MKNNKKQNTESFLKFQMYSMTLLWNKAICNKLHGINPDNELSPSISLYIYSHDQVVLQRCRDSKITHSYYKKDAPFCISCNVHCSFSTRVSFAHILIFVVDSIMLTHLKNFLPQLNQAQPLITLMNLVYIKTFKHLILDKIVVFSTI